MPAINGFAQLQPSFILGTNQWVCAVAEQMVGADIDRVNQLRDHFPFHPVSRAAEIVVPRVARLCTAGFVNPAAPATDDSGSILVDPPETVEMTCIEGSVNLA